MSNKRLGLSKHPLYRAWAGMVNRCTNPNNSHYHLYGGRGIKVCDRWRTFKNFLDDMGERPEGMSLDRIDPLGDYENSNCRWATPLEQRLNYSEDGDIRQREGARAAGKKRWLDGVVGVDTTTIENCVIMMKNGETSIDLDVLDGYVICPIEMFTRRRWSRALSEYRKGQREHAPDWQKDAANVR